MYHEQLTKITKLTFTVMPHFYLRTSRVWTPCPSGSRKRKVRRSDSIRSIGFAMDPVVLYAPEDLMPRAAEITLETGVIIYDALFLALAEDSETVVITADGRLLKALEGTAHARLAHPLADAGSLVPDGR